MKRKSRILIVEDNSVLGESRVILDLEKELGRPASSKITVLIRGETGTGTELVTRALHRFSEHALADRAGAP